MSYTDTNATNEFDLIRHLSSRNMYQRLGLKSNVVTPNDIEESWKNRLQWIREAFDAGEIDQSVLEAATRLLEEARNLLINSDLRRGYDVRLAGNLKKTTTTVTVSNGRVTSECSSENDRYELDGVISEGPRAKLWLARDKRFDRQVVVKQIHLSQLRTTELQQRFREEANFFASSNAVHLVKVLDFNPDSYQVILEWLPDSAQMLAERLRLKKGLNFSYSNARQLLRQALSGLDVLHRRGWVHGRVCAAHILLDDHGNAKLSITPGLREVSTLSVPGKEVTHLAPEMLNPQVFGEVTARADLYSLGFLILDLLCRGELRKRICPAVQDGGDNQVHWFRWHASTSEQMPPLEQLLPDAPPDLLVLLASMTQKRPGERPQDAQTALQQLDELQQTAPNDGAIKGSKQLQFVDTEMEDMEDFGPPPRLPQIQYETKQLDWKGWLKAPTANYHLLSQNQKLLLIGGVVLVCGCLLILGTPANSAPSKLATSNAQDGPSENEENATGKSDGDNTTSVEFEIPETRALASEEPLQTDDIAEFSELPIEEIISPSEDQSVLQAEPACMVFVTSLPGFQITGIDGHKPTEHNPTLWKLPPGEHVVRFTDASSNEPEQLLSRTIRIGEGDQFEHVVVGQVKALVMNTPSSASAKPAAAIDFRMDLAFRLISSRELNAAEEQRIRTVIHRLIDRAPLTLTERRGEPVKLAALEKEKRRDPRISFLLALDAYLLGHMEASIALCKESIAVTEMENLPFQLPYHLLSHVYAKQKGRTPEMLALALQALKHAEKIVETSKQSMNAALLGEELWFYGHVLQHVSDQTQITALDLNYWQRKGTELEVRYHLPNNPIQQGRDDYLMSPYTQAPSPLRLDPALLAERVRQTLPTGVLAKPQIETTVSR
jgi:eukaryotic-like serine/threonine-protein kinase